MGDKKWSSKAIVDLLPRDTLQQVCEMAWDYEYHGESISDDLCLLLAEALSRRPVTIQKLKRHERSRLLVDNLRRLNFDPIRQAVLEVYATVHQRGLDRDFLAAVGMSREALQEDNYLEPPHPNQLAAAVDHLRHHYPPLTLGAYLGTLGLLHKWDEALRPCVDEFLGPARAASAPAAQDPKPSDDPLDDILELGPLDRLLLGDLAGRVGPGQDPSCPPALAAALDHLVALAPDRPVSHFHRGFAHGLHSGEDLPAAASESADAALWALAGQIMALVRRQAWDDILALCRRHPGPLGDLFRAETSCGAVCAARVFAALWGHGHCAEAAGHLTPGLMARMDPAYVYATVEGAQYRLECMAPTESLQVIEIVSEALRLLPEHTFSDDFQPRLDLLAARCLCGQGAFDRSLVRLEALLANDSCDEPLTRLYRALARAQYRWPCEVHVPLPQEIPDVRGRLDQVADDLKAARPGQAAPVAHYALGVRAILRNKFPKAVQHLTRACDAFGEDPVAFYPGQLRDWAGLYRALAVLCARDESGVAAALDQLQQVDHRIPVEQWPDWLFNRALAAVGPADDTATAGFVEWLSQRCPDRASSYLSKRAHVRRSPRLRQDLEARATDADRRTPAEQWDDNALLLDLCFEEKDEDATADVLDRLESLALEHESLVPRYVDLLSASRDHGTAWNEEEISLSLMAMWRGLNRPQEAFTVLQRLFYQYRARAERGDRSARGQAIGLLDVLPELGLPDEITRELIEHGEALAPTKEEEQTIKTQVGAFLKKSGPVSLLVVGGDEREVKTYEEVKGELAGEYRNLELHFEYTPRTSRWAKHMNRVENRLDKHEAFILSPYMRTNMGHRLRRRLNREHKPWLRCNGGQDALERAVYDAVLRVAGADADKEKDKGKDG